MEADAETIAQSHRTRAGSQFWRHTPRPQSFLQRNLRLSLRRIMGAFLSAQSGSTPSTSVSMKKVIDDMDDAETRPAKRLKRSRPNASGRSSHPPASTKAQTPNGDHVTKSSTRLNDLIVPPTKALSKPTGNLLGLDSTGRTLRVDLIAIKDNRSRKDRQVSAKQLDAPIGVRCSLSIWNATIIDVDGTPIIKEKEHLIRIKSLGMIEPSSNEASQTSLHVKLDEGSFSIAETELYVNQPSNSPILSESFGLDKYYIIELSLRPVGALASSRWPPVDIGNKLDDIDQPLLCKSSIQLKDMKTQDRESRIIVGEKSSVNHSIRFNVRWDFPMRLRCRSRPRVPLPVKFDDKEVTIVYTYHRLNHIGTSTEEQFEHEGLGFTCAICCHKHPSWDNLRFHLKTDHTDFCFEFSRSLEDEAVYYVVVSHAEATIIQSLREGKDSMVEFQLGPPRTFFNFESYLDGDKTWIDARRGSAGRTDKNRVPSSVSSAQESLGSTPITSVDMDFERPVPTTRPRKHLMAPNIKQRMFHSIFKTRIYPGDELSDDDEERYVWQIARHKDVIHDFTDITDEEKDFIVQWDSFIMPKNMTTNRSLPEYIYEFLRTNRDWFAQTRKRKMEFGKHILTLLLRGAIDQECYHRCTLLLNTIKSTMKTKSLDLPDLSGNTLQERRRKIMECSCGQIVIPALSIICRGPKCNNPYFHRACLNITNRPKHFLCAACSPPGHKEVHDNIRGEILTVVSTKISADVSAEPSAGKSAEVPVEVPVEALFDVPVDVPLHVPVKEPVKITGEILASPQRKGSSPRDLPSRNRSSSASRKATPAVARKSGSLPSTTVPARSTPSLNSRQGARKSYGDRFVTQHNDENREPLTAQTPDGTGPAALRMMTSTQLHEKSNGIAQLAQAGKSIPRSSTALSPSQLNPAQAAGKSLDNPTISKYNEHNRSAVKAQILKQKIASDSRAAGSSNGFFQAFTKPESNTNQGIAPSTPIRNPHLEAFKARRPNITADSLKMSPPHPARKFPDVLSAPISQNSNLYLAQDSSSSDSRRSLSNPARIPVIAEHILRSSPSSIDLGIARTSPPISRPYPAASVSGVTSENNDKIENFKWAPPFKPQQSKVAKYPTREWEF